MPGPDCPSCDHALDAWLRDPLRTLREASIFWTRGILVPHRPPLQSPRSPDLPTRADRLPHGAHNHAAVCATPVRTEAPATTPRPPQERPHLKMLTKLLPLKNLDHPPLYDPPSFRIRSFMTRVAALTPATTLATFVKRFPPEPRTTLWTC